jgi:hypothetical protein
VVEAANIAPVVVTVRCLGSAEFEKLSGGSLPLSSQTKMIEAIVARALSQNECYEMMSCDTSISES